MEPDFKKHNQEVKQVWDTYYAGKPYRIPMVIGINPRYMLLDSRLNPQGITFQQYFEDPETMFRIQLEFRDFVRHHVFADHEMGIPENGWEIYVDFQNNYESAWFGCPIVYKEDNCPVCPAILDNQHKHMLFEKGMPDPFSGIMGTVREYTELFNEKRQKGFTYKGAPLAPASPNIMCTDGPFTLACNLRGVDDFCVDMYEDPDYAHQLLAYITAATIERLKAWRRYLRQDEIQPSFFFADDSVALLSADMYREWIYPYHKQLIDALSTDDARNGIHLCGDASRHFRFLKEHLNITTFDTGYPLDHRKVLLELGPDVCIQGGPSTSFLLTGSKEDVVRETGRILSSVKDVSHRFILRDANNLSPRTPLENIRAMYETVRTQGVYL